MPLKTVPELYELLPEGAHAIGGFNVNNMEYVQAVVRTAEEERAPVILMLGEPMLPFIGLEMMTAICRFAAESTQVPMAVSLDHGRTPATIDRFIELGLSIMVDGSKLSFEENIAFTRRYVQKAHERGLPVEGELGTIGGSEDGEAVSSDAMTDPEAAARFVEQTGVDALAVAIGNKHGLYRGTPDLDLRRLARINSAVPVPLVLHGGSDLPPDQVTEAMKLGIKKVNIGTDLKIAYAGALKENLSRDPMPFQPPDVMSAPLEAMCRVTREKIRLFGSGGLV